MAVNLPTLPETEKLSTNIIRILGGNPSKFTLQGSNTYLLGTGPERILLDTGEGKPSWSSALSSVLGSEKCSISQCLLSHWHHDHVGGVNDLLKIASSTKPDIRKHMSHLIPYNIFDPSILQEISPNQTFSTNEGFEIKAIHTPGHTTDHTCFIITSSPDQSEVGAIFTFDNVLGHGTAVFEDLTTYLSTLALMKDAVSTTSKPVKAYPGHGAVIDDAAAKIQEYIDHRKMREEEALNVLRYGTTTPPPSSPQSEAAEGQIGGVENVSGKEWTSMEMVKVIYRHYPESLWQPAEGGLLMVLEKLRGDGKVRKSETGKWSVAGKAAL